VAFLEKKLGAAIDDDDVVAENFESIAAISRFIAATGANGRGA
jgi:acyl carrier protein